MEAHLNQIGRNKLYERQVSETKKKEEQETLEKLKEIEEQDKELYRRGRR